MTYLGVRHTERRTKLKTQDQVEQCLHLCDELEKLGVYTCYTDSIRREVNTWLVKSNAGGGGNPAWDHYLNCGCKGC